MKKAFFLHLLILTCLIGHAMGQQAPLRVMSGVLLSTTGEPLPGVSILIKGTNRGTVSNIDGWYRIEAPLGAVLVYSFIGFTSYEVTVSLQNSTSIEGAAAVAPAPPTPQARQKRRAAPVQPGRLLPTSTDTNTRGVAVLSDSAAGYEVLGRYNIYNNRIQGPISRIRLDNKTGKLIFVPAHIAEEQALRFRLSFTTALSRSTVNGIPQLQDQYAQGRTASGELVARGPADGEPYSWGPAISALSYDANGQLVPRQYGLRPAKSFSPQDAFRSGWATDNQLQLFARAHDFSLRSTYDHKAASGILPTNHYGRHYVDVSLHKERGVVQPKLYFSHSSAKENMPLLGANQASVLGSIYTSPPTFDLLNGHSSNRPWKNSTTYLNPDGSQRSFAPGTADHPYWLLHNLPDEQQRQTTRYGLELSAREGIPLSLQYHLLLDKEENRQIFGIPPGAAAATPALLSSRNLSTTALSSKLSATRIINKGKQNWEGEVFGGYTFRYQQEDLLRLDGAGFVDLSSYTLKDAEEETKLAFTPYRRTHEVITKASFDWKGKRYDKVISLMLANNMYFSNTLASTDRAFFLPSLSLKAFLHDLDFVRHSSVFTKIVPSASYTQTVQEAPLLYNQWHFNSLQLTPSLYKNYYQQDELYATPGLKPEKQERLEAGLSLGLFDKLYITGNFYRNSTEQLILPVYSNGAYQLENSATIITPGLELSLDGGGYFNNGNWQASITFSRTRPRVKEIYNAQEQLPIAGFSTISTSLVEGQPYGVLWGSRFLRTETGQLIIGPDGFPLVDPEPGIIGNPNPDWLAGFSAGIEWHGFNLSFVLDAKKGGQIWNGTQQFINYYGTSRHTASLREVRNYVFEGVSPEGDENQLAVDFYNPALPLEENRWQRYGEAGVAEEAVQDASWLRLQELQLSYYLPYKVIKRLHLQSSKLSLLARNLLVVSGYSGSDPAASLFGYQQARGLDLFNQPNVKCYGIALTITL